MSCVIRSGTTIVYNESRAKERFTPASSFKVFNTLIALEEQAIRDKDDVLKWDGTQYTFKDWNSDQTLASAYRVSCVWCYQQMARRVGVDKYASYIAQANYGALENQFDVANFWLDGSLKISAEEQIAFLKKAYLHQLPFSQRTYDIWREVTLSEQTDQYRLFGKTGWAAKVKPQIGWYVGFVETTNDTWVFATNITVRTEADLALRQLITKAALETVGAMPKP